MTDNRSGSQSAINRPEIVLMPVDKLLLDDENPRLASAAQGDTQMDLLRVLWNEMAVDELALSIAANGFFHEEPLLLVPKHPLESDERKQKYIVVEGNRRLAAVRLLLSESLRDAVGATDLPRLGNRQKVELLRLPVSIYRTRKELWHYFGFRHINGPKPWDAFSKAMYVADVHESYGIALDEIARRIGDKHATVKRLYRGYKILEQAESKARFSRDDIVRNRFYFSHLYTAADQPEFQKFLAITPEGSLKPNPVPNSKLSELREFMVWLYGSKSANKEPIVRSQNPDLNTLREVISKPEGLRALRGGASLERAYEVGIGDKERFQVALARAKEDLLQAKATVTTGYAGESDLYDLVVDIVSVVETIRAEMETKLKRPARGARAH